MIESTPKGSEQVASKPLGTTTATDITSTSENGVSNELHFAKRGEAPAEASTSQEDRIEGYDPELMGARTLLTAEEEKKLLRRIDWRLMSLCSLIFMFKNLDSNNVRVPYTSYLLPYCITYNVADIQCSDYEPGDGP
jgi:hypothetical protein